MKTRIRSTFSPSSDSGRKMLSCWMERSSLIQAVLDRDADGNLIRRAGVMGVVLAGGDVLPNGSIDVRLPEDASRALIPV